MASLPSNDQFIANFSWHDFLVTKDTTISELSCRLVEVQHVPTQASILHIQNTDPENLFCFAFRTLPMSSNGIAHILEHTVLCGSDKFPVRDPFFSMTRRSLNTFMNAFTGADFTCYPASSQLEKDFYNLLEVYADAVFHPKLDRLSFLQEGWRYEFEGTSLQRKGVVFNEMKGALSSPMTLLHEKLSSLLFPDNPYGFNSGGDPKVIPTLTLEELKAFHKKQYHPSRCLFYFYGSFQLAKHLLFLEKEVFHGIEAIPSIEQPCLQARRKKAFIHETVYPVSNSSEKSIDYLAMGWLTVSCTEVKKLLSLAILDGLLMEQDSSPLKRRILDSKIAHQAYSSIDGELREVPYILTLTGISQPTQKIHDTLLSFLKDIAKKGFSKKEVDRVLQQMEIDRKEITRDQAPYGLTLFWRSALMKQHGVDPLVGLQLDQAFKDIKGTLKHNPRYFSDLLEEQLIQNSHLATVRMSPSSTLLTQEKRAEEKELKTIATSLSKKEKEHITKEASQLEKRQNKKEDLSCLPSIAIKDISKKALSYPLLTHCEKGVQTYFSNAFTNDIVYITLALPLPLSLFDNAWTAKLYSYFLPQLGCGKRTWKKALEYSQEYTGGIQAYLSLNSSTKEVDHLNPHLHIHGKALSKHVDKLLSLLFSYAYEPRFDETTRIQELLQKHVTTLESNLIPSSLRYATSESEKSFSLPAWLQWKLSGRDYVSHIRSCMKRKEAHESILVDNLYSMREALGPLSIIATAGSKDQQKILSFMEEHARDEKAHRVQKRKTTLIYEGTANEPYLALDNGADIAFSSLAFPAMPYSSKKAPLARLLGPLLDNLVLHKRIREQGGAYGAGATYNPAFASFTFYSYRDPNIWSTYRAFYEALERVAQGKFDVEDLNEAKRECIQALDEPISPFSQAEITFGRILEGKTDEMRQSFRTRLIQAKSSDLQELAAAFLHESLPLGALTTATGRALLDKESSSFLQAGKSFEIISL